MNYYPKPGTKREEALRVLAERGKVKRCDLMDALGIDARQFNDCLNTMIDRGLVITEPRTDVPGMRGSNAFLYSLAPGVNAPDKHVRVAVQCKPRISRAKPKESRFASIWDMAQGITLKRLANQRETT